jgi:hypothetical protein
VLASLDPVVGETMIGTCVRCGKPTTATVPIMKAESQLPTFVCLECVPDVFVPYVGGPFEGGYTPFRRTGLVLDGVHEERPIPAGADKAERYVLRCDDAGWAFVYAGPVA